MNYAKFTKLLAFLLVLALCLAFSFGLASPVSAAVMPSANNLYGEWLFNEQLTLTEFYQEVKFTTKSDETNFVTEYAMELTKSSAGYWWLYYYYAQSLSNRGSVYSFTEARWKPSSTYRWVDFGDEGQVVSEEFFTWLTANATFLSPVDPEGPVVDSVTLSVSSPAPYYPGTDVQLNAEIIGTGIEPGSPESTFYWFLYGNSSEDTFLETDSFGEATLHIATDETATSLEIEARSTYDTTKSATVELPVTYPLEGVQIIPSGEQQFVQSDKQREMQFSLLLPNGDPYNNPNIQWIIEPSLGAENYYGIDSNGLLVIKPDAPVGSSCNIRFAYANDLSALSPVGASVKIINQLDGIQNELDDYFNSDHGFDSSGSDFSGVAGDLQNSSNQMNNAMSGGMNHLGAMMNSVDFTTTLTTLGSGFDALFVGHEVTICGVTANPFELVATIVAIAILLPLALKFIFRKWGSGSGGGSDA